MSGLDPDSRFSAVSFPILDTWQGDLRSFPVENSTSMRESDLKTRRLGAPSQNLELKLGFEHVSCQISTLMRGLDPPNALSQYLAVDSESCTRFLLHFTCEVSRHQVLGYSFSILGTGRKTCARFLSNLTCEVPQLIFQCAD